MKIRYHLPMLSPEQRILFEYLLLDEIDKQGWYAIVFLRLWNGESYISTQ